jgi:hypothetical protein
MQSAADDTEARLRSRGIQQLPDVPPLAVRWLNKSTDISAAEKHVYASELQQSC